MTRIFIIAAAVSVLIGTEGSNAQCDPQRAQEIESTHDFNQKFGRGVAISQITAVIGTPLGPSDPPPGLVDVYEREGGMWIKTDELLASNGAGGDEFGLAIDIDGDTIVIGARKHDGGGEDAGAAYVYRRDGAGWVEEAVLDPKGLVAGDYFGAAVAIDGDTIVVGASLQAGVCNPCVGRAYVFNRLGGVWQPEAVLEPSDGDAIGIGFFGNAVDIQGNTIIVGAYSDDSKVGNGGSVYVFEKDLQSWIETQKLYASDQEQNDQFGFSLALDGDVLAVGADEPCCPDRPGSAYVFERIGGVWQETAKLLASDGENDDLFGWSVAVWGDSVVVGAILDYHSDTPGAGSAYVFHRDVGDKNQWGELAKLPDPTPWPGGFFGFDLAVSGNDLFVGQNAGFPETVFVFDLNCTTPCPWDLDANGSVGASDLLSLLADWGPCKGCDADFDHSGNVGASDLLALLANWGPCP